MRSITTPFKILLCIGATTLGCMADSEQAAPNRLADPIYVANQNPFVQIFGLPKAESGIITPKGKLDAGFTYHVSNNAISSEEGNETIIWDGETAQYNMRFRYGVSEHLELGMDIPYVDHSGGYLDSLIRHYHDLFGMSNERQEKFEKNKLHYKHDDVDMTERANGFGDIRFSAAIPLFADSLHEQRYLALRPQLKLPTGDADDLLGSGGTDVSMGLAYSDFQSLRKLNMALSAHAGAIYMGNTKVLRDKQRHFAGYGGVALNWMATDYLVFKLQMDLHTAFYDSELKQLGSSMQLLAGGTARLPGNVLLDLGISEQLITDATPDVGFYLSLRHLF